MLHSLDVEDQDGVRAGTERICSCIRDHPPLVAEVDEVHELTCFLDRDLLEALDDDSLFWVFNYFEIGHHVVPVVFRLPRVFKRIGFLTSVGPAERLYEALQVHRLVKVLQLS